MFVFAMRMPPAAFSLATTVASASGDASLEDRRTALCQHTSRVDGVLGREGNAMERTDFRAGPDRRLGPLGGFHRISSQRHDSVHLGVHFSDAVEMGLHDLDGRKLAAGNEFGEATGLHARDVVGHDHATTDVRRRIDGFKNYFRRTDTSFTRQV